MNEKENIIILIGGGSASGKTLLANELIKELKDVTYVPVDMYCKAHPWMSLEERSNLNYDHPDAYSYELLYEHLLKLKAGNNIEMPIYDFATHDNLKETKTLEPKKYIIVDGILTLHYQNLVDIADYKIYMDTDEDIRLKRRTERDVKERGRTKESVLNQFTKTVKPMHDLYIEPSKANADFIFINNDSDGLNEEKVAEIIKNLTK